MILCYKKRIHELMTIAYVELYSSRFARTNCEPMSLPLVLGLVAATMISGYPPALYISVLPY
jgi:arginine/lysine/ornithine decarboxylase